MSINCGWLQCGSFVEHSQPDGLSEMCCQSRPPHAEWLQNEAINHLIDVISAAIAQREAFCAWSVPSRMGPFIYSLLVIWLDQQWRGCREFGAESRWSDRTSKCSKARASAIFPSVYYRQRTIQNTKQSIEQQEQIKRLSGGWTVSPQMIPAFVFL